MSDSELHDGFPAADRGLVDRLRAGDRAAVAEIEERFGAELRLFCQRMTGDAELAADIVQDLLATCCDVGGDALPHSSLRGWLYQITRRRCIDLRRRRNVAARPAERAPRATQPSLESAIDPLTTPAGKALKRDRATRILGVLHELDEDLRSVIIMRYFQDLPREEIADALGLSIAGTKARLSRAMEVLRDRLDPLGESGAR